MPATPDRAKLYAFALLAGALLLLVLATTGLDGRVFEPPRNDAASAAAPVVLLEQLDALYSKEPFSRLLAAGRRDLFATDHFNPPPAPPPVTKPAVEPPKTRTVPLTYLGLLGGSGEPTVYVRADKATLRLAPGAAVVADWRIARVGPDAVVLTNAAAATHQLDFRRTVPLEIPLR
jgi:hypothetical protein